MECPKSCDLLLYACPAEINDLDLAKLDKIHDLIVDASVDYFEVLKKQFGVHFFIIQKLLIIHNCLFSHP